MEKGEPSLVPQWLRNNGAGILSHRFASSQADDPLLAQPKRNRTSKSFINSNAPHTSCIYRSSSINSRRSSSSNDTSKHDKNPFSRSYGSSTRNHQNKDRDKLGVDDTWDFEYCDPLTSITARKIEKDTLRRSQSIISQRGILADLRNRSYNIKGNGNGFQKGSFQRDFPSLGADKRPTTPDIIRAPSPGLNGGVQGLPLGTSLLIGSESWTSALAVVPTGVGSNSIEVSSSQQRPHYASTLSASSPSNGLNMAEALVHPPAKIVPLQPVQTQRSEELPFLGSKQLIPLTPLMPKTFALNPSDKLKPKTAVRSNEAATGLKNGLQQMSSFRADAPKSSSTTKLLLLKPGRDNVVSPVVANGPCRTIDVNSGPVVANGPSNQNYVKLSTNERLSLAQLKSRNNFFNLVRKKSMNTTCAASSGVQNPDKIKEMVTEKGSDVKCNGDSCSLGDRFSDHSASDFKDHIVIDPDEKEAAFLRSLGWEENAGDDDGLTEEEISAFVQEYVKLRPASTLCRALQLKSTADCSL